MLVIPRLQLNLIPLNDFGKLLIQCHDYGSFLYDLLITYIEITSIFNRDIFNADAKKSVFGGRELKAIAVFRKGIAPEWEDEGNARGCDLITTKQFTNDALEAHWEQMIYAIIGEVLDDADNICGIRAVNQKKFKSFKFEIWLKEKEDEIGNKKIKAKLLELLTEANSNCKPNNRIEDFELSYR